MAIKNLTRARLKEYTSRIALLNGLASPEDVTAEFTVEPSVQQTMETAIQESSEFLKMINITPVDEPKGEALGLLVSSPIASRTDTRADKERTTTDPTGWRSNKYACEQTNFDTHIRYPTLDAWAKFKDFQTRIRDAIIKRQALDRIMIGFNGISVAENTDKAANPLLQDVNIGWLQKIRANAPERHMSKGGIEAGIYYVGEGTTGTDVDYQNLDALATDLMLLLDPWAREDPDLVVICGSDLIHDKEFPIINKAGNTATEIVARDQILKSAKQLGGKPAISVPFFPANAMLITTLKNLSIYYQDGARRRSIIDNPKKDRVENYESSNEAYVLEDYGFVAFIENIHMGKKAAATAAVQEG